LQNTLIQIHFWTAAILKLIHFKFYWDGGLWSHAFPLWLIFCIYKIFSYLNMCNYINVHLAPFFNINLLSTYLLLG
jgi:exosortase/archaeosortase